MQVCSIQLCHLFSHTKKEGEKNQEENVNRKLRNVFWETNESFVYWSSERTKDENWKQKGIQFITRQMTCCAKVISVIF